jgi:large subunit ribosomal protein L15
MRLHNIGPKPSSKKRRRRIGRGISAGQGASGGFGMRGQKSRSGTGTKPGFEGGQMPLYRRVPKLKHFTVVNRKEYTIINVEKLANLAANSEVTLESLMAEGIITTNDGPLKVLGNGDLGVALNVKAAAWTKSAQVKIEAAGGSISAVERQNNQDNSDQ